ncbi:response regulator [uncultured Hymenobacter sp.]|uniref:response regulator n=1 Tax=uncultured Hymenobacter sp. TaxID=170016 RepID=UPI0035CA6668
MRTPKLAYVVEDDPITSSITKLIVKKSLQFSEVQTYANGQRALDCLLAALRNEATIPDLILLDLNMPLMDGWEFLDAFGRLPLAMNVCVFILTSSIHPDDIDKAKYYKEVRGYFSKPLDKNNLARMQQLFQESSDDCG